MKSQLDLLDFPKGRLDKIADCIMATKYHNPQNTLQKILCDADLCVLSLPEPFYEEYVKAVRKEYSWATDEQWRGGRIKFLQGFLERDCLFHYLPYNMVARKNLSRELALLQKEV